MKGKLLRKFEDWSTRNGVHLDRHISIMNRHADIFREYVELIKAYTVTTPEFVSGIMGLHERINSLVDEMKETNDSFAQDCSDFQEILDDLKQEMLELVSEKR